MNALTVEFEASKNFTNDITFEVSPESLRTFAKLLMTFLGHDTEIRDGVASMASIVVDPDASEDEIEAAVNTMKEGLFPSASIDLEAPAELEDGELAVSERMDSEEGEFAAALRRYMEKKSLTQEELADAIGVGQPAISMMLSRSCRPQRRTVEKLARALEIAPSDLWSGYEAPELGKKVEEPLEEPLDMHCKIMKACTAKTPRSEDPHLDVQ